MNPRRKRAEKLASAASPHLQTNGNEALDVLLATFGETQHNLLIYKMSTPGI